MSNELTLMYIYIYEKQNSSPNSAVDDKIVLTKIHSSDKTSLDIMSPRILQSNGLQPENNQGRFLKLIY